MQIADVCLHIIVPPVDGVVCHAVIAGLHTAPYAAPPGCLAHGMAVRLAGHVGSKCSMLLFLKLLLL